MPNRIPTPGVKTPAVRVSKSAQPAVKPKPIPTKGLTKSDAAYATMLNKAKGDVTKVKGFSGGKGVE